MARILIAGCGATGSAVANSLAVEGHDVYGLKRHPPAEQHNVNYIKADLTHAAELETIDVDYDLVIYILSPDDRSELSYRRVFEYGVNNLLEVFMRRKMDTRFIFVSSTGVYGQSHGEWVDENSIARPVSITGQIILQAEKAFLAHSKRNCVIRFSGIYGRGKSHLLNAIVKHDEVQHRPPYYMNRIHWQDCVSVICFIASKMIAGEDLEPIYLASDDDPAPKWDVFNFLAGKLDVEPPQKAVMPSGTGQNKRCSNKRLKQLGYRFRYPGYKQGFSDINPSVIDT